MANNPHCSWHRDCAVESCSGDVPGSRDPMGQPVNGDLIVMMHRTMLMELLLKPGATQLIVPEPEEQPEIRGRRIAGSSMGTWTVD